MHTRTLIFDYTTQQSLCLICLFIATITTAREMWWTVRPLDVFSASFSMTVTIREPFVSSLFWALVCIIQLNGKKQDNLALYCISCLCGTLLAEALSRVYGWKRSPNLIKTVIYTAIGGLIIHVLVPQLVACLEFRP